MMIATYLVYLVLSLGITYWVGQTLHRNGRVFLVENFHRYRSGQALENLVDKGAGY